MYRNRMIGLSTCGSKAMLTEVEMTRMRAVGIDCLELSYNSEGYRSMDLTEVARTAQKTGMLLWSIHLPFDGLDIAAIDPALLDKTMTAHKDLMRRAAESGIGRAILHCCLEPVADGEREQRMRIAIDSVKALGDYGRTIGMTVCCEDLPRTCLGNNAGEMKRLIGDHPFVRIVFDTNHLLMEKNMDFLRQTADRIVSLHVSDYDFVNERHWLPGEGDVDWSELMPAIFASGYDGPLLYELGLETPKTITRPEKLTYERFVENARQLIDGLTPAPFGTRIANLGMWGPADQE